MKITEIKSSDYNAIELKTFKPENVASKAIDGQNKDKVEITNSSANWQKDILLSALDMIESQIQLDEDYPLDKLENRPIESFDEALIELRFTKTEKFKQEALQAQANISAEDILSLFVEDAA